MHPQANIDRVTSEEFFDKSSAVNGAVTDQHTDSFSHQGYPSPHVAQTGGRGREAASLGDSFAGRHRGVRSRFWAEFPGAAGLHSESVRKKAQCHSCSARARTHEELLRLKWCHPIREIPESVRCAYCEKKFTREKVLVHCLINCVGQLSQRQTLESELGNSSLTAKALVFRPVIVECIALELQSLLLELHS